MKTFLVSLVALFGITNFAYAYTPGETVMAVFFCKKPEYSKMVAEAIVTDDEHKTQEIGNELIKEEKCVKLPVAAEIQLVKEISRVPGTKGRPSISVWQVKNTANKLWYGIIVNYDEKSS